MTHLRRSHLAILALLIACVAALAACGSDDDGGDGGATITTMFGDVQVPENPQRVVALGWSDAEVALALDVQPVGASDWLAFGGEGVGPWAEGRYDTPPTILGTLEVDYERISELNPDLIINTRSDGNRETHDELSKIAPTVGPPPDVVAYGTNWRQQMEMVSTALGKAERGEELIAEVDAAFAEAAESNPQFAEATVGVGAHYADKYAAYMRGDSRVDFMEALGFTNAAALQDLAGESFSVDLSREQIELLDADLTVVFPIGGDAQVLRDDRVLNQIPSAADGRLIIMDDPELVSAFSSGSTLGTLHALDAAVPLFAKALPAQP